MIHKVSHSLAAVIVGLLFPLLVFSQERFDLEFRGGHYFFTADVCGAEGEIMLESGIPALLVSREFYDKTDMGSRIDFETSSSKIRLFNNAYDIAYRTYAKINIGHIVYDGPIFILEEFDGIRIPIQYLKDGSGKGVMTVDLKEGYFFVGETAGNLHGKSFRLSFDKKLGFPVVKASLCMTSEDVTCKLKGNCIVDFGNPMLVFLFSQNKSVAKAVKKGRIELKDARNAEGKVVAQGIYADSFSLLGKEFHDVSIGVTDKMPTLKQMCFLGVPFFDSPVTFDFDKGLMTIPRGSMSR